jgi:signal transduction histidine kinase
MAHLVPSESLRAERQFTRSVLAGIVLLGLVAVAGPLLSYGSDVQEARGQFRSRVARESHVYAEALGLHLKLLKSELARVALGVGPELEVDLAAEDILDLTSSEGGLFRQGVVLLDADGSPRWSHPAGLFQDVPLRTRPWFQRVLAQQVSTVDAISPGSSTFAVAVPVVRRGKTAGLLVGVLDAKAELPGARPTAQNLTLMVLNRSGDLFIPEALPAWAAAPGGARLDPALAESGGTVRVGGDWLYVWTTQVPGTELSLMLASGETATLEPIRSGLLMQLLTIVLLQVGTLLLFSLYGRRVYRLFLEMERRAAEKETMAALGSAAGLIAHEVKNSLNGLKAATGMLPVENEQGMVVQVLRGQIDRLAHLATSLLHFGKPPPVHRVPVELPHVVHEVLEGLRVLPEADEVHVEVLLPEALGLSGDPLLLASALDNLVRNAMEAAVAAKDLGQVSAPQVWVRVRREEDAAVVEVEDNAGGPPPDFERRLFEPFVTTKPKGVGLGLSMARRAVEQQGGRLMFTRIPGGSRFAIRLPLQTPAASPGAEEPTP